MTLAKELGLSLAPVHGSALSVEAEAVISATMESKRSASNVMAQAVPLSLFAKVAKALGYRDRYFKKLCSCQRE